MRLPRDGAPPLGASISLAATYREKALVLIPLYFGPIGLPILAVLGAAHLP